MKPARFVLLLGLALPLAAQDPGDAGRAGAPLDPEEFRYAREVLQREPGLVALTLDAAVLAHSSLSDLRIADAQGRQVPYLRERSPDPLIVDLPAPERVEEEEDPRGTSRYRLRMPYDTLPLSRLVVDTPADVFERTVHLEGRRSPRGDPEWRAPSVVWRDPDPGTPAPPLELEVPARPGETVDLLVDEGDNAPLPLGRMRLHLDTWTLRFFHPGGSGVRLLYGRDDLGEPRYDLSLIAARLDPTQAREVVLAPEPAAQEGKDPARVPRGLFWGALVAAVAVLLLVLARLVREGDTRPQT
jgi:hypothetical protein